MAQQDDETTQTSKWLQANGLSIIINQCLAHEITLEVLTGANAVDIKDICDETTISAVNRVKLKNALKKMEYSVISNDDTSIDEKKESQLMQLDKCKFSDEHRSHFGRFTLSDDKTVLSKPVLKSDISDQSRYCCASLDINPIRCGIHCFRIKIVGKDNWLYIGIHANISRFAGNIIASASYYTIIDTKSCGAEILGGLWYRIDTSGKKASHKWKPQFVSENGCHSAVFDMMVTLSGDQQVLTFTNIGADGHNALTIPIITRNAGWIPHFILYSATDYPTMKLQVAQIDAKSFGNSLFEI